MTATEASFVRALCDDPDDDATLLVFADWLDDQDDPSAELLRIQQELSRWTPELQRRLLLQERERQLLQQFDSTRMESLCEFCLGWKRQRGLATLTIQPRRFAGKRFARMAREAFARGWVGGVQLRGGSYLGTALRQSEHLLDISALDLSNSNLVSDDLYHLVESPFLKGLRHLTLAGNRLDDIGVHRLAESPLLEHLHVLDLRNNAFTAAGLEGLLRAAKPGRLRRLEVQGNILPPATLQMLADWHTRQPLRPEERDGPHKVINSLGMEFVRIPAGTFLMGAPRDEENRYDDELPRHSVTLTRPYYLAAYQVTQGMFHHVMGTNPSRFNEERRGGPNHPVDFVTWIEAEEFCRRLGELPAELELGHQYRLPTEAEWEHACRSGTSTVFFPGDKLSSYEANFDGTYPYGGAVRGPYRSRTMPVGSYRPNAFGLYDTHGNVWEWCADWYDEFLYSEREEIDPQGPETGYRRVLRGGSWFNNGGSCRSAYRYFSEPETRDPHVGFRVVLG
jgi:uncharacterized protein (TIGR02996 family)